MEEAEDNLEEEIEEMVCGQPGEEEEEAPGTSAAENKEDPEEGMDECQLYRVFGEVESTEDTQHSVKERRLSPEVAYVSKELLSFKPPDSAMHLALIKKVMSPQHTKELILAQTCRRHRGRTKEGRRCW